MRGEWALFSATIRTGATRAGAVLARAAVAVMVATPAWADDAYVQPALAFVEAHVRPWIEDPAIVANLKIQNGLHTSLTFPDINELDARWRLEFGGTLTPLIDTVRTGPMSDFLRARADDADGVITEIIVMDVRGLNAGISDLTSDYWQGDEDKWKKTYLVGAGAVFVDEPRHDQSTRTNDVQVSMTITDPTTGQPIGAITIGINLEAL